MSVRTYLRMYTPHDVPFVLQEATRPSLPENSPVINLTYAPSQLSPSGILGGGAGWTPCRRVQGLSSVTGRFGGMGGRRSDDEEDSDERR